MKRRVTPPSAESAIALAKNAWSGDSDPTRVTEITIEDEQAFSAQLLEAQDAVLPPPRMIGKQPVAWAPQPGSQELFLRCPLFEALVHGTRGGGKTDSLVMAYSQYTGRGFGESWRGIIFRRTYPELADVVAKSQKWFRQIFPAAEFNRQRMEWRWPGGEVLLFRHMARPDDYWSYHGHEYPFIGFEELTNWPSDECYVKMFSCCRSPNQNVPRMVRATTNPYGVGHNWVKARFALHGRWWQTITQPAPVARDGSIERSRTAIHSHIDENRILLNADPDYKKTITASASNQAMVDAWLHGSWDIVAGGMLDDVWSPKHNCLPEFVVPNTWRIDRSFDWGSSRPFSVGWWAESDGCDLQLPGGRVMATVRGDLFRIREWYGWTGRPNEGVRMLAVDVSKGIVEREMLWGMRPGGKSVVRAGPADSSIFSVENGVSIAHDMQKPVRIGEAMHQGITWTPADKRPGSRKSGWEMLRKMVRAARPTSEGLPREAPGLFVVEAACQQFLRTVPSLPRDERDPDDVDTDSEDHIGDEVRYRVRTSGNVATSGRTVGMF